MWFGKDNPYFYGVGPFSLDALRYYGYVGEYIPGYESAEGQLRKRTYIESPATEPPDSAAQKQRTVPKHTTTWIGIELVDDDGVPIEDERYRMELPD